MASYDSAQGTTPYRDRTPAGELDPRAWAGPGTPGADVNMTAPYLASIGVAPGNLPDSPMAVPRVQVSLTVGDSSGSSSDNPYGLDQQEDFTNVQLDYGGNGVYQPGSGRVVTPDHPNSGARQ